MENNKFALLVKLIVIATVISGLKPAMGQEVESLSRRIINWSEVEQKAWISSCVANGIPPGDELGMLVLNRGDITLPLLESKIEEIIRSSSPKSLFTSPSVDPAEVVRLSAALIASAGTEQSLREASKLIKIDARRFDNLVQRTLVAATARGNAFAVAYRGLELNDPAIERRVIAWVHDNFWNKQEPVSNYFKRLWAEALVEKYSGIPSLSQIANDPIATRLKPVEYAALEMDIKTLVIEAASKRLKR